MSIFPVHGGAPAMYAEAVEAYLTAAGIGASSQRIYRISLTTWAWLAAGEQPPIGRAGRGAKAPALTLAVLDRPDGAVVMAESFAVRAALVDADTVNRELSVFKAAAGWWRSRGWIATDPTDGVERRPAPPDWTRALTRDQVAVLFELKAGLREKTLWRLLYETCARAEEILTLDIEDLVLTDKRGRVVAR
jgi:integrase/recombinase XerD